MLRTEKVLKRLSEGIYPGLICAIIIMVLMGLPGKYFPTVVSFWDWLGPDKIVHLFLFAVQSFLLLWGYRKKLHTKNISYIKKAFMLTLLLSISYGGLTELLQKYTFTNRYGSLYDFYADAIGCVLGVIVFFLFYKKKLKKIKISENNI